MFSKILIKLIDQAIIPALLLLTVRVISVVAVSRYLGIDVTVQPNGIAFTNPEDYILINSYSIFAMVVTLLLGLTYILVKSLVFHDTHVHPGTTARLYSFKLSRIIQSSYDLYTQGAIWMSYIYLLTIVGGIMAAFGLIYRWVFTISFLLSIVVTVMFILDIEHEVKINKTKDPELDVDWEDQLEEEEDQHA